MREVKDLKGMKSLSERSFGKRRSNACKFRDNGRVTHKELLEVMQRLCAALHLCGRAAEKSRRDRERCFIHFGYFILFSLGFEFWGLQSLKGGSPKVVQGLGAETKLSRHDPATFHFT